MAKHFKLTNRNEVILFEQRLDEYVNARAKFPLSHISLTCVYDDLQSREDGERVFISMLDLYVSFLLLLCDVTGIGGIWNEHFSKGKLEGGSILDSNEKFFGKMDIHRFSTSYVLRYRAIWDKVMGFLILFYSPKDYETFTASKSKQRTFRKLSQNIVQITPEVVQQIGEVLTEFDNTFRTPEAHGTGALRKWTWLMESLHENPQVELIKFWNVLNGMITQIGKLFKQADAAMIDNKDA